MKEKKHGLSESLENVARIARATAWKRFIHAPLRYITGQFFNKIIYPFSKEQKLVQAKTFFGVEMKVALPAGSDIYFTAGKSHPSEINLAYFLLKEVKPGSEFADIGAHFGYFTLLAATLVGQNGRVHSFEPGTNTFSVLEMNSSRFSNIQAANTAISDESGQLQFYEFPTYYSEYNTVDISQFEDKDWIKKFRPEKIKVQAITIDDLVSTIAFKPNIIKMDVEGAEGKVIKGGMRYFKEEAPVIVMEYLSASRGNEPHKMAVEMLLSLGYRVYILKEKGALENVTIDRLDTYLESQGIDSDNIVLKKVD
ncbi:MAG TPA: FkbM family methyltransferase [Saprospiraceae bacterium]|jgi:FkbM family methyltransferase|nr:FkbM family methyltransferase [Saprospiraceae bacterium]HMT78479.1 FkbM family methyltransferase [Saprospiraceae bacterium]